MKLIKKIAAIMLSVIMVLGMASVVSAGEGETAAPTGMERLRLLMQYRVKLIRFIEF